jgi:hypothetical protein
MEPIRRWSIEQHVRADAESIFVPVAELAEGAVGDLVDIRSPEADGAQHLGRIVEQVNDPTRGEYFIVRLDDAPDRDSGS